MSGTDDRLVPWLLEQIAADAAQAQAVGDAREWARSAPTWVHRRGALAGGLIADTRDSGFDDDAAAEHIATWDPTRVLAECEAKRAIIEADADHPTARPYTDGNDSRWNGWADCRDHTLRVLALPYADRPGYRESWRP